MASHCTEPARRAFHLREALSILQGLHLIGSGFLRWSPSWVTYHHLPWHLNYICKIFHLGHILLARSKSQVQSTFMRGDYRGVNTGAESGGPPQGLLSKRGKRTLEMKPGPCLQGLKEQVCCVGTDLSPQQRQVKTLGTESILPIPYAIKNKNNAT